MHCFNVGMCCQVLSTACQWQVTLHTHCPSGQQLLHTYRLKAHFSVTLTAVCVWRKDENTYGSMAHLWLPPPCYREQNSLNFKVHLKLFFCKNCFLSFLVVRLSLWCMSFNHYKIAAFVSGITWLHYVQLEWVEMCRISLFISMVEQLTYS